MPSPAWSPTGRVRSVMSPVVVILPTLPPATNHSAPSGPDVICPEAGAWNRVTVPASSIRPIAALAANHTTPSGPRDAPYTARSHGGRAINDACPAGTILAAA